MFIFPRMNDGKSSSKVDSRRGGGKTSGTNGQSLPKSPTSSWINLVGLVCCICAVWWIRDHGQDYSLVLSTSIVIAALALPILALEMTLLQTYRNRSTGIDFERPPDINLSRAGIKYLGFIATIGFILCAYWLFTEYHDQYYAPYFVLIRACIPLLLVVAFPYFLIIDRYMVKPKDGYWQAGQFLFCRWQNVDCCALGQHCLGWLVKLFFLPLMFIFLAGNIDVLRNFNLKEAWLTFNGRHEFLMLSFYSVDLVFACVGYLLTIRLFDSHIRSTEPSLLGWGVALCCYPPFSGILDNNYLTYEDSWQWWNWWQDNPMMYMVWGTMILLLTFIYSWATFQFGIRFSNLTHRGILTNGPYRFTKHPAYVCKNLSWWLISMPFLTTAGWPEAVRHSLLLLGVNLIYLFRARTEERHLSYDPDYVQYGRAMDEKSIFAWLGRFLPVLRYRSGRLFNTVERT